VLKLSSTVSDVFPKVLKLSPEVSECKPLHEGQRRRGRRGRVLGRRQCIDWQRHDRPRVARLEGRGLHSSTFQLNLSQF
jgi:hypothetical protein